nr:Chain B, Alpha-crystallin B chain [Homo sapiens]
GERTIPITRE